MQAPRISFLSMAFNFSYSPGYVHPPKKLSLDSEFGASCLIFHSNHRRRHPRPPSRPLPARRHPVLLPITLLLPDIVPASSAAPSLPSSRTRRPRPSPPPPAFPCR